MQDILKHLNKVDSLKHLMHKVKKGEDILIFADVDGGQTKFKLESIRFLCDGAKHFDVRVDNSVPVDTLFYQMADEIGVIRISGREISDNSFFDLEIKNKNGWEDNYAYSSTIRKRGFISIAINWLDEIEDFLDD